MSETELIELEEPPMLSEKITVDPDSSTDCFKERISMLKEEIKSLKSNLIEEKTEWQKELQETLKLCTENKPCAISRTFSYDKLTDYRYKLLEVEKSCNMELNRIKRHVQCLTELQLMTSFWSNNGQGDVSAVEITKETPSEQCEGKLVSDDDEKSSETSSQSIPNEIIELDQEITELEKKNSVITCNNDEEN